MFLPAIVIDNTRFFETGTIRVRVAHYYNRPMNWDLSTDFPLSIQEGIKTEVIDDEEVEITSHTEDFEALIFAPLGGGRNYGVLNLPQINEKGFITFISGNERRPLWVGSFFEPFRDATLNVLRTNIPSDKVDMEGDGENIEADLPNEKGKVTIEQGLDGSIAQTQNMDVVTPEEEDGRPTELQQALGKNIIVRTKTTRYERDEDGKPVDVNGNEIKEGKELDWQRVNTTNLISIGEDSIRIRHYPSIHSAGDETPVIRNGWEKVLPETEGDPTNYLANRYQDITFKKELVGEGDTTEDREVITIENVVISKRDPDDDNAVLDKKEQRVKIYTEYDSTAEEGEEFIEKIRTELEVTKEGNLEKRNRIDMTDNSYNMEIETVTEVDDNGAKTAGKTKTLEIIPDDVEVETIRAGISIMTDEVITAESKIEITETAFETKITKTTDEDNYSYKSIKMFPDPDNSDAETAITELRVVEDGDPTTEGKIALTETDMQAVITNTPGKKEQSLKIFKDPDNSDAETIKAEVRNDDNSKVGSIALTEDGFDLTIDNDGDVNNLQVVNDGDPHSFQFTDKYLNKIRAEDKIITIHSEDGDNKIVIDNGVLSIETADNVNVVSGGDVNIDGGVVKINGGGATLPHYAELDSILSAIFGHVHIVAGPAGPTSPPMDGAGAPPLETLVTGDLLNLEETDLETT